MLTGRFIYLPFARAYTLKITSSRRLLTAGYPTTTTPHGNFREFAIAGGFAFGPLAFLTPVSIGDAPGSKTYGFSRPASRVACASLRRRDLTPNQGAAFRGRRTNASAEAADTRARIGYRLAAVNPAEVQVQTTLALTEGKTQAWCRYRDFSYRFPPPPPQGPNCKLPCSRVSHYSGAPRLSSPCFGIARPRLKVDDHGAYPS